MELALSLGHHNTSKPFKFLDQTGPKLSAKDLGFCMGLGSGTASTSNAVLSAATKSQERADHHGRSSASPSDPPLQLDLLPFSPVPRPAQPPPQIRFPWLAENLMSEPGSADGSAGGRGFDVNRMSAEETAEEGAALSSPNSAASSFQMDFAMRSGGGGGGRGSKRDLEISGEGERGGSSRNSDDEENALTRKKLRLSKEQSAFLEESFKEHSTLNPKQKLALAKQLNLRPRQVEVWFQNRRARTKLKQTEVDCEYLKRCCETLTEENRRLQKELQELRALKSSQPFYMQLPATTLTMCPSCERVATTTTTPNNTSANGGSTTTTTTTTNKPGAASAASAAATTTTKSLMALGGSSSSNNNNNSNNSKTRGLFPLSQPQPQSHKSIS